MSSHAPSRILVAAHTPTLAYSLRDVIATAGHDAHAFQAGSAAELLDQLRDIVAAEKPTLLLLELKHNADALASVRGGSPLKFPVVVMLTAARPEIAFIAAQLGAVSLLLMSHADEDVVNAVADALQHPMPSPEPAAAKHKITPAMPVVATAQRIGDESIIRMGRRASLEVEAVAIRQALEETRWNRKEAARRLKISYKSLLNRLKVLGLDGKSPTKSRA